MKNILVKKSTRKIPDTSIPVLVYDSRSMMSRIPVLVFDRNFDREKILLESEVCQKFKRESLKSHTVPNRPFEKVGVDIGDVGNIYNSYVLLLEMDRCL